MHSHLPFSIFVAWRPLLEAPRWAQGGIGQPAGKSIVVLGTETTGNSSSSTKHSSSTSMSKLAPLVTKVSDKLKECTVATSDVG